MHIVEELKEFTIKAMATLAKDVSKEISKIQDEVNILSKERMEAAEQGDLRENAKYHEISEQIERLMSKADRIQIKSNEASSFRLIDSPTIKVGSLVEFSYRLNGKQHEHVMVVVPEGFEDYNKRWLASDSTIGSAILGGYKGLVVPACLPTGDVIQIIIKEVYE